MAQLKEDKNSCSVVCGGTGGGPTLSVRLVDFGISWVSRYLWRGTGSKFKSLSHIDCYPGQILARAPVRLVTDSLGVAE